MVLLTNNQHKDITDVTLKIFRAELFSMKEAKNLLLEDISWMWKLKNSVVACLGTNEGP